MPSNTSAQYFYSQGKLLITGEYLVLHGATALATPVKFGQSMEVFPFATRNRIIWEARIKNALWFRTEMSTPELEIIHTTDHKKSIYLRKALSFAHHLNPHFLSDTQGWKVITNLNYPQSWGLGSSATFINNLALWAQVNPHELYSIISSGSGYDIACALADSAILFERKTSDNLVRPIQFQPTYREHIYFLYQGKKQDTSVSVNAFQRTYSPKQKDIDYITNLTHQFVNAQTIEEAIRYVEMHETYTGNLLQKIPIQKKMFPDFPGTVKSLGAWGGDFAMVLSKLILQETKDYFHVKGFDTLFKFDELIPNKNTD